MQKILRIGKEDNIRLENPNNSGKKFLEIDLNVYGIESLENGDFILQIPIKLITKLLKSQEDK